MSSTLDINVEGGIISGRYSWQSKQTGHSIENVTELTQQWQLQPESRNIINHKLYWKSQPFEGKGLQNGKTTVCTPTKRQGKLNSLIASIAS